MPTPNNTVSLLIAGKTHSQWTDYDIDSNLLTPADDFHRMRCSRATRWKCGWVRIPY